MTLTVNSALILARMGRKGQEGEQAVYGEVERQEGRVRGLRCAHCGAVKGLVKRAAYIGGTGYVSDWYCRDVPACVRRDDERRLGPKLAAWYAERAKEKVQP